VLRKYIVHPGEKRNRLTVISEIPRGTHRDRLVEVRCDCGKTLIMKIYSFMRECTRSCGCVLNNFPLQHGIKHGMNGSAEYQIWSGMKERCLNPKSQSYANYGERGITVCQEWLHDFQAFYDHIGPRPSPKHTLDRIDNNEGYRPGNVRWATWIEQASNRRNNVFVEIDGERMTCSEAVRRTGLSRDHLRKFRA
jgi:hypothetical protein